MRVFTSAVLSAVVLLAGAARAQAQRVGAGEPGPLGVVAMPAGDGVSTVSAPWASLPVRLALPQGVHVYWHNPGEAGLRTRVEVTLPRGWAQPGPKERPPSMPPPIRFVSAGVVGFGYEGEVVVAGHAAMSPEVAAGSTGEATVTIRYLACDADRCVPGSASFAVPVVAGEPGRESTAPALAKIRASFDQTRLDRPSPAEVVEPGVWRFALPGVPAGASEVAFFPATEAMAEMFGVESSLLVMDAAPEAQADGAGGWTVTSAVRGAATPNAGVNPPRTVGVVAYTRGGERRGFLLAATGPTPEAAIAH